MPESQRNVLPPHALGVDALFASLQTSPEGHSSESAARRLASDGPNRLPPPEPASAWTVLRDQLRSVVVLLLVAAGGISLLLGDVIETGAIAFVLFINTAIGFVTELRAHRAMEALSRIDTGGVDVFRDGVLTRLPSDQLVVGDVVQLSAGQTVSADARLLTATDCRLVEAALTGESLPVSKRAELVLPGATPLADRRNMIYRSTIVLAGSGRAVVTATGGRTEIGRVGQLVSALGEEPTPLEERLDILGHRLVGMALGVAALVTAVGLWRGEPFGLVIEMGIALAVAAVPEALPAVATIALAVGLHRMAKRNALVRRLPAVEALGSVTVICTDKTRTLTSGDMAVAEVWTSGRVADLLTPSEGAPVDATDVLLGGSLASRVQADQAGLAGDPVDRAVLRAADWADVGRATWLAAHAERGLVPFGSERQLQAAFYADDGRITAYAKGAPARILALSTRWLAEEGDAPLDLAARTTIEAANDAMASRALRVLAVARGHVETPEESGLRTLTFVGLLGLLDPPAPGVEQAIRALGDAGLRTIMLTGDQRVTAEAIGRRLGVIRPGYGVVDGGDLEALSPDAFGARLADTGAFSRVSPEHKLRIVEALQARGEIVAMLGDGVNDAPALKKADVGVAMGGRGTDAAREASDIVLRDDRFETIVAAVEEGRVIYENIRRFVFYLFSCNVAEVLVLLVPGVAGLPSPLLPLQILWLNMVTDTFPALALAMEPADRAVMQQPPRPPDEALLAPTFLRRIAGYAALITATTLGVFLMSLEGGLAYARTMAFSTLAVGQIAHLGNARSAQPVLSPARAFANLYAVAAVALSLALQVLVVQYAPLAAVLQLVPLTGGDWLVVAGFGVVPGVVGQAVKLLEGRR